MSLNKIRKTKVYCDMCSIPKHLIKILFNLIYDEFKIRCGDIVSVVTCDHDSTVDTRMDLSIKQILWRGCGIYKIHIA